MCAAAQNFTYLRVFPVRMQLIPKTTTTTTRQRLTKFYQQLRYCPSINASECVCAHVCVYLPVTIFVWPFPRFKFSQFSHFVWMLQLLCSLDLLVGRCFFFWHYYCCCCCQFIHAVHFVDRFEAAGFRRFLLSLFQSIYIGRKFPNNCCPKHARLIRSRSKTLWVANNDTSLITLLYTHFLKCAFLCWLTVRVPLWENKLRWTSLTFNER